MLEGFGHQFYACGKVGLPESIRYGETPYGLERVLKRDFFAETGLYERRQAGRDGETPERVVLKVGRRERFLVFPMGWMGRILCANEVENLRQLSDLPNVPRVLEVRGRSGFLYGYIEGHTLDEKPEIPERFFDKLSELLAEVHRRNIAYLDMNKRGNIIVGKDSMPYLIDFQIAWRIDGSGRIFGRLWRSIRRGLQKEDRYHLCKHKRKFDRKNLTHEETQVVERPSIMVRAHRLIATPLRRLRRWVLRLLYQRNIIKAPGEGQLSRENDPRRFCK